MSSEAILPLIVRYQSTHLFVVVKWECLWRCGRQFTYHVSPPGLYKDWFLLSDCWTTGKNSADLELLYISLNLKRKVYSNQNEAAFTAVFCFCSFY